MATTRRPATALAARNTLRNSQKLSPLNLPLSRRNRNRAISYADGAEISDALAGGMMVDDRVFDLRRHPHPATRSLLLKVHFVQRPEVYSVVLYQLSQFFYEAIALAAEVRAEVVSSMSRLGGKKHFAEG